MRKVTWFKSDKEGGFIIYEKENGLCFMLHFLLYNKKFWSISFLPSVQFHYDGEGAPWRELKWFIIASFTVFGFSIAYEKNKELVQ